MLVQILDVLNGTTEDILIGFFLSNLLMIIPLFLEDGTQFFIYGILGKENLLKLFLDFMLQVTQLIIITENC